MNEKIYERGIDYPETKNGKKIKKRMDDNQVRRIFTHEELKKFLGIK